MITLPTILTLSRLALLPVIIALFFMEGTWGAQAVWLNLALYILCALTDFFDGWWARKYNQVTPLGTFLDPISDKIFVAALLVLLVAFGRLDGLWVILPVVIMAREFLVSGLREFLGPHNVKMPVTKLAKWKTAAQMLALALLVGAPLHNALLPAGHALLALAALLTVITGWAYLKVGLDHMRKMP